jgi:hypothetical protein
MSEQSFALRFVARGTVGGVRRRRVETIECTYSESLERVESWAKAVAARESFDENSLYFNVLPPSGIRLDGQVSKGHGTTSDGVYVLKAKAVSKYDQAVEAGASDAADSIAANS